jgi:hypothetical protein
MSPSPPTLSESSLEALSEGFEKAHLSDARHIPAAATGVWFLQDHSPGENPELVQTGESHAYD